ncbi:alpha/beta fold hydrolase [Aromatoleum diolicum]|uniref:Alpha/beta fold hydrolase n=2 Tax=Aromatoleum diolicum TaxID=75796 RepID=A0ABX1QDR9_9RHOO|nr:alpha/beta hydrolase [Aromatoleum diolicum]NMG75642.1 alpha/beta fold hydrolase [Aromatoleum diolicum]
MDHFRTDDGERIHVKIQGDGPPLVLLHGWTASHRDWNPFIDAFAARHRVFRWDARGHGGHPLKSATVPTAARMARDLEQMLEHWQLRDAIVVGHSMGALTLWQYIHDFGCDRLRKVVIIDQSPRILTDEHWSNGIYGDFDERRNAAFVRELQQDFAEGVLRLVGHSLNERARRKYLENGDSMETARQRLREMAPQPLIDCWTSLAAADYRDVLEKIDIPSLLVYGGASNFYHTRTAHYVRDNIPNALLHIYEDVDHAPHQWQRERFVKDVLDFIDADD